MATDFGTDFASYPDVSFTPISGPRVVAESLYRRFTCTKGLLDFHPDYGDDVRELLNASVTNDFLAAKQAAFRAEGEKDERVFELRVDFNFDREESTLDIKFVATTADGPFKFTIRVTSLTATLLFGE